VALFGAMTVWIFILMTHLSFRRRHPASELPVRMPWFPWLQFAAIGLLIALLVTMGLDEEFWGVSWIVGVPWLALISIAYFVRRARMQPPGGASTAARMTA
jgi:L-asparagine transporter-like permease